MVELVDTQDLKSCDHCGRAGSTPASGTHKAEDSVFGFFYWVKHFHAFTRKRIKGGHIGNVDHRLFDSAALISARVNVGNFEFLNLALC